MKIVLFCHPAFLTSQSMPRFAQMLKSSFEKRGHEVEAWSPRARFHTILAATRLAKWGGYIDQYVFFPRWVRKALSSRSADTLFVFCDQALGPWIPLVSDRPHVVHVHDLLALRCALGDIKENPSPLTGRIYQRYIRRGFQKARHFISVSKKTRDDLHRFGQVSPLTSEYVYNGLNFPYRRIAPEEALQVLQDAKLPVTAAGMVLHVGGNQWYKNLSGVIAIYAHYARDAAEPVPLWCVGRQPTAAVRAALERVPAQGRVYFLSDLDNATLRAAYSFARVFLFPSLAEGFGWPIVEALACGCPVITSDEPPMNEFAGDAILYVPRLRFGEDLDTWAQLGAALTGKLVPPQADELNVRARRAQKWGSRFDADKSIDAYLSIYQKVFNAG